MHVRRVHDYRGKVVLCGRKAGKKVVPHLGRSEIAAFAEFDLFFFIFLMSHMYKEGA